MISFGRVWGGLENERHGVSEAPVRGRGREVTSVEIQGRGIARAEGPN